MSANELYNLSKQNYDNLILTFQRQNSIINLSSFNDTETILKKHILDSLEIFNFKYFNNLLYSQSDFKIADIGTGGGFPGLVLAIALPQIQFFLIESKSKKCNAISNMALELKLKNLNIINDRVENISQKFDVSVSRAVAKYEIIYSWALNITKDNGRIYLYKSSSESITGFNEKTEYNTDEDSRIIYEFIKN